MRRQILALLLRWVGVLSGCAVSQGQGSSPFQGEDEEIEKMHRPAAYHRPWLGISYPVGIGPLLALCALEPGFSGKPLHQPQHLLKILRPHEESQHDMIK